MIHNSKKTKYKVYDLRFLVYNKWYHFITMYNTSTKQFNFSNIELNPLQTREESKVMFEPMIRNNEYKVRQLSRALSYNQALKIANQYKLNYMYLGCSLNKNYNITNLNINIPKVKQAPVKKIPKKLQNIKNPVLRERLIKQFIKQSKKSN